MGKKLQRRPVQYERDPSGCMWGLVNMFDFYPLRTTQKLLADKRTGNRHAAGAEIPNDKLVVSTNVDENHQTTNGGKEETISATGAGMSSVKKLIEEEMSGELDSKKINDPKIESKEDRNKNRKDSKRRYRSRTKSGDVHVEDLNVSQNSESGRSCLQNICKRPTTSLEIDKMVEEFCRQVHQKSISGSEHHKDCHFHDEQDKRSHDLEEKLIETIKLFIDYKLTNEKCALDNDVSHPSKELMDALQILSSDEKLFLRLLQDQKSLLVKYFQNSLNDQVVKDEDSKSVVGSNLSGREACDSKEIDEVIRRKQGRFFRRKAKSMEKKPSNKDSQMTSTLSSETSSNNQTEISLDSSIKSELITRSTGPVERVGSYYFLSEIKRKLKHAMSKEWQGISAEGASKRFFNQHDAGRDGGKSSKENLGMNSSSKDHFFIEKAARSPRKGEKAEKSNTCGTRVEKESNVYIEAKKHLSEMLSDRSVDKSSSGSPVTLGRILHLPEYSHSPIYSPAREWSNSCVTSHMRLFVKDKSKKQEDNYSSLSSGSTDDKTQDTSRLYSASAVFVRDIEVEDATSIRDEITSEGVMKVLEASEIILDTRSNILDTPAETCCSSFTPDDQNRDTSVICNDKSPLQCLNHDSNEHNLSVSSPVIPACTLSANIIAEDPECALEIHDRQSPVSVLEPLFTDGDTSPSNIRSEPLSSVDVLAQPLIIQFEENDPLATEQSNCLKTCNENKEITFEYVNAVLQASSIKWDELYAKPFSSDQLLDEETFDVVQFFPDQLCCEKKLLFDCISEVLMEIYRPYFVCFPALSFVTPTVRPLPDTKHAASDVCKGVYWHMSSLPLPHTLDQLVQKDLTKTGTWMDLRYDAEAIIYEISETIFDELMEDAIWSFCNNIKRLQNQAGDALNAN